MGGKEGGGGGGSERGVEYSSKYNMYICGGKFSPVFGWCTGTFDGPHLCHHFKACGQVR